MFASELAFLVWMACLGALGIYALVVVVYRAIETFVEAFEDLDEGRRQDLDTVDQVDETKRERPS